MSKKASIINLESIKALNPCKDRLDNYVKFYATKSFTTRQFMGLKNISHQDKLWVAFRSLDRKSVALAAADIAESVLHIYESRYPSDKRPRETVEAMRLCVGGKITREELNNKRRAADAAYDAAYAAAAAAAYAAAYAAAAYAAYAYAAYAADAADAAAYAVAAARSASTKVSARAAQEKLCRTIILRYWK